MPTHIDPRERARLLASYREARCDIWEDGAWRPLQHTPMRPLLLLSAWNPGAQRAGPATNAEHDRRLRDELVSLGLSPLRARGRGERADASEEGWLIPHEPLRTLDLLRRYGQLAGTVFSTTGRSVWWADGMIDRLDTDRCPMPRAGQERMNDPSRSAAAPGADAARQPRDAAGRAR